MRRTQTDEEIFAALDAKRRRREPPPVRFDPDMVAPGFESSAVVETIDGQDYFRGLYKRRHAESAAAIFRAKGRNVRVEQVLTREV